MSISENITADNIFIALKYFANQYRKEFGNQSCEITIVGGASVLLNYGFRDSTQDVDYFGTPPQELNDIVLKVADKLKIDQHWLNDDFKFSPSYSPKLREVSTYFCSYNNGNLEIRTVKGEPLAAMKMLSGREALSDIPDIIGIIRGEKKLGNEILFDKICEQGDFLYGDKFVVSESLMKRVKDYCSMNIDDLDLAYRESVNKAYIIKEEIIIKTDANKQLLNRDAVKELGIDIEKKWYHTPGSTGGSKDESCI